MIDTLVVGELYTNDDVFTSLNVGNAGGIRLSLHHKSVMRAAIMTSVEDSNTASENPYHDRLEGSVLTYTAAGKVGEQTLAGVNQRIFEQKKFNFPAHGFVRVASRRDRSVGPRRWRYLGLLEYLRHYPDTQLDADGKVRKVWLFEFRIHEDPPAVPIALDAQVANQVLAESRLRSGSSSEDDEIIEDGGQQQSENIERMEHVRARLLNLAPRGFEIFIRDLLVHCGFCDVCVTRFTADGGVDVNARTGGGIWLFENTLVQVQAKRWLHSVGRKEVAELRGSLQPFARGAVVTTSHFSKAAINEAAEPGKNPIALIDGLKLSRIVLDEQFPLANRQATDA